MMAEDQPFRMLFETFGRTPIAHAESVNRQAHEQLARWLDVPTSQDGGCILLRAPRAGYGKTHLLSRVRHSFHSTHETILMRASRGYRIDAATVLEDILRHLLEDQPGHLGLTRMDVLARRTMASALVPLVESGEVPCENKQAAIDALRGDPQGTFDFHNPRAVTAQWAKESFSALSERLLPHLARACDLSGREIGFWLQALFHYCSAELDDHRRHQVMEDKVCANAAGESGMMNRLEGLLALMTLGKRVVLIADDLEGFSSDRGEALNLATLIMALRQTVPRLDVLISLNQDVWDEVFVPCLSDGLADRLSERLIELHPLSEADMVALLDSRAPGWGSNILAHLDRNKTGTHARGLIREAAKAWERVHFEDLQPEKSANETFVAPVVQQLRQIPTADTKPEPQPGSALDLRRAQAHQPQPADVQVEERTPLPFMVESVDAGARPQLAASESTAAEEPPIEERLAPLDPEDQAKVETLLEQFRKKFGHGHS